MAEDTPTPCDDFDAIDAKFDPEIRHLEKLLRGHEPPDIDWSPGNRRFIGAVLLAVANHPSLAQAADRTARAYEAAVIEHNRAHGRAIILDVPAFGEVSFPVVADDADESGAVKRIRRLRDDAIASEEAFEQVVKKYAMGIPDRTITNREYIAMRISSYPRELALDVPPFKYKVLFVLDETQRLAFAKSQVIKELIRYDGQTKSAARQNVHRAAELLKTGAQKSMLGAAPLQLEMAAMLYRLNKERQITRLKERVRGYDSKCDTSD